MILELDEAILEMKLEEDEQSAGRNRKDEKRTGKKEDLTRV